MEKNIVKIKCPCCGALLALKMQPGIENKNIPCPVCKENSHFKLFKIIDNKREERTVYPPHLNTREEPTDRTHIEGQAPVYTLGRLKFPLDEFPIHKLNTGKNIIGRKASGSIADCQIPIDNKRISREHIIIDVKKDFEKGYKYYISLYKEKVNKTLINNEEIKYGDCIVLKNNDLIILPELTITFEIPNDEETELN